MTVSQNSVPLAPRRYLNADDARLDYMINVLDVDQITACRLIWGHLPVEPVPPAPSAPVEEHRRWARAWVKHLVATRLGDVIGWLAGGARR